MNQTMHQVLAELELVSHGTTAAWGRCEGGEGVYPPGERNPPHVVYRARWVLAWGPLGRRRVLREARAELERCRRAPRPRMSYRARILMDWAGTHYGEVARVTGTPALTIYRWRRDAGLEGVLGLPR